MKFSLSQTWQNNFNIFVVDEKRVIEKLPTRHTHHQSWSRTLSKTDLKRFEKQPRNVLKQTIVLSPFSRLLTSADFRFL